MRIFRLALLAGCGLIGFAGLAASWQGAPNLAKSKPSAPQAIPPKGPAPATLAIDFNRDVRPILSQHCWPCHGSDKAQLIKTGNMRLDNFKDATADRGGHRAIVPGKLAESVLWTRVSAPTPEMRMPPKDSGVKQLNDEERATLKKWIEEGAEYRDHWAYIAPKLPALPPVSNPAWCRNSIDRFVLAKLDAAGLRPEPEADKATLLRRATLTLTGLQPTPAETDAFLADKSPDAYEKAVDRLLASPRYGENQARFWLDAVRYADTHGLHIDNERAIFPYRDWVVRAFNEDLPFGKFAQWQIAGDLLPDPTTEQRIATGYVRMNPTTNEGGVIEAEFLAKNTMDRVDTTATVFLGMTMACAKCHDHKYDPISMRDYYSMYAFFNSTADPILDGNLKLHTPFIKAALPEQDRQLAAWRGTVKGLEESAKIEDARTWIEAHYTELPAIGKWEVSQPYIAKDFDAAFATDFGPELATPPAPVTWKPVVIEDGKPKAGVIGKDNAASYVRATLTVKNATEFAVQLSSDDGIKVWLNGELIHSNKVLRALNQSVDTVKLKLKAGENTLLAKIVNAAGEDGISIVLGDAQTKRIARVHDLAQKGGLSSDERREIAALFLEIGPDSPEAKTYRSTKADIKKLEDMIPETYVAEELPKPRPAFMLKRGAYDHPGDPVVRAVPAFLGRLNIEDPENRLGLANWLTDPKNPLVGRVFVNRVWQQHFGTGIVKTSEDFGSRGAWPSHPELLDYLACKFNLDGRSVKKLNRLIVTSAAFRQAASASQAKRTKDPENILISRGPRFRLDAEVIRDQALYASGLLVEKGGGRGDKPYNPPGLWEIIAYPISDTAKYVQDHGDALYRRSLYLFWKRTSPPATMMIFDAPMRESCVVRRSRTNTPLQALATLNDPQFVEAARAMAQKVLLQIPPFVSKLPPPPWPRTMEHVVLKESLEVGNIERSRLELAFRLGVGRSPNSQELNVLTKVLREQLSAFGKDADGAKKLLKVGESKRDEKLDPVEHAAWTMVCSMILNLDEAMTQH